MKVLLAEDAEGMRNLVVTMLKSMGIVDVVQADNGAKAWKRLQSASFDLLLTDWNMPVLNGLDLVHKVREEMPVADMAVIIFTSRNTKQDVVTALKAGIDGYLAKPFTLQQLQERVATVMAQRSQMKISQIRKSIDIADVDDEHSLVLFGETASTNRELARAENRDVLNFLTRTATAIDAVNDRGPDTHIGFLLASASGTVSAHIRQFRERIKLLVVSADIQGGGVTLARLASVNRRSDLSVLMICNQIRDVAPSMRQSLEALGIVFIERDKLDIGALEQLFDDHIFAKLRGDIPAELPSPEEIRKRLERDIQHMVNLPVLPQVYHQIVELDKDRESDLQGWVEAIKTDPLTQAQVIRRARSPIYGFRGEIDDIGKAITLLGKNTVKELVVSSALHRACEGIEDKSFQIEEYWLHSAATGITAQLLGFLLDEAKWTADHKRSFDEFELEDEALAILGKYKLYERFPLAAKQDPFIGGMMHDIGKVAMVHAYPGLFPLIVDTMEAQGWNRPMSVAEELSTGGLDHCQVGRILGESWKLGDETCRVVEYHHQPAADDSFTKLITLANFLATSVYRYPGQARYPLSPVLQEGKDQAEAPTAGEAAPAESEDAPTAADIPTDESTATIAGENPSTALKHFLPPSLLPELELPLDALIDLGKTLTPTVRRLTEKLRQG